MTGKASRGLRRRVGRGPVGHVQSAMEYLMTYSWSILIIAIVLGALFALGTFNNASFSSTTCTASSGYLCQSPVLNTTGNLLVTFGTSSPMTITGIGCSSNASAPSSIVSITPTSLQPSEEKSLVFSCPVAGNNLGTTFTGQLWVVYNHGVQSGLYANIGTITAKIATHEGFPSQLSGQGTSYSAPGTYAYVTNYAGVGTTKGNVVIVNTATNTVVDAITSGFNDPEGVAIYSDGSRAYITNLLGNPGLGNVLILDPATNTITGAMTQGFNYPTAVAFSPSGTYAYVTNYGSNNVVIINTATSTVTGAITSGFSSPYAVAFSPSGTFAYVANEGSNNVVIINTATSTVVDAITQGINAPDGAVFSNDGSFAYVSNEGSGNVVIVNTATSTVVGTAATGVSGVWGIAISPDGSFAYVTNWSNVVIISTATNTVVGNINNGFNGAAGAAFYP